MYSASVDDNAMTGCRFDLYEIVEDPTLKTYPEVDFQFIKSPPQSASACPDRFISPFPTDLY